jgi:hypothetical protein
MKNIFIGLILVFLDFNITLGNSKIGLIPDFIGYIVMITGLVEMSWESPMFAKVKPYVTGMAVYSGIIYILDLFGASVSLGAFTYILAIISTTISLYISYNIVMGVIDMEGKYTTDLNGDNLKSNWKLLVIFDVLSFLLLLIPVAGIISIIISFIIAVCFLVAFSKSKDLYYNIVR